MKLDFDKIMLHVAKHGKYKKIVFKNKKINWCINQIGWFNLCTSTIKTEELFRRSFYRIMKLAEEGNKESEYAFVPDLDFYETVTI